MDKTKKGKTLRECFDANRDSIKALDNNGMPYEFWRPNTGDLLEKPDGALYLVEMVLITLVLYSPVTREKGHSPQEGELFYCSGSWGITTLPGLMDARYIGKVWDIPIEAVPAGLRDCAVEVDFARAFGYRVTEGIGTDASKTES